MRLAQTRRLIAIIPSLLLFFGAVSLHAQSEATYYYVSPTGNDSNPGTESLPWKTLAKAASMATANVTVFIKQGTYNERLVPVNSGTADGPITFTSYPGDSVIISGVGIKFPAGQSGDRWWSGLVHIENLAYIKLSGLRVVNSEASGILATNCSHITIERNYTGSTFSSGIVVNGCNDATVDANEVVRGCMGIDQECISFMSTKNFEIKNNCVHDGLTEGIDVKVGSSNGIVTKNEVYNQEAHIGIYIEAWTVHQFNIDVYDNLSHDNVIGFAVTSEMGGLNEGIRVHHNIAYNNNQRGFWVGGWGGGQTHPVKNINIYGNESYGNGFGIEIGGYTGSTLDSIQVYNNLIYHNKNAGVRITRYDGPSGQYVMRNVSIINNTIYGNGTLGGGWDADNSGMNLFNISPENLLIRNNIISSNAYYTIFVSPEVPAASVTVDYNFFNGFKNIQYEIAGTNALYGNPLFVDSLRNDYHLQITSPCIDKGHPDQTYNDPSDPSRPGYALYPARGTIRNDMGAYGGPFASSPDTVLVVAPQTPALIVPADSARNVPLAATLSWNRVMGATLYHLQLSIASNFSTTVVNDSTLSSALRSVGPLALATTYYWRVRAKNDGGWSAYSSARQFSTIRTTSVEQLSTEIPTVYSLTQNYPNPFNPTTRIRFGIPKSGMVLLKLFDILGREIETLVAEELAPAYYEAVWKANVASGIYFYRIQAGDFVQTRKMILLH